MVQVEPLKGYEGSALVQLMNPLLFSDCEEEIKQKEDHTEGSSDS